MKLIKKALRLALRGKLLELGVRTATFVQMKAARRMYAKPPSPYSLFDPFQAGSKQVKRRLTTTFDEVPTINVLDIGARGGIESSFPELTPAADMGKLSLTGVEPDREECQRLNSIYPSFRYFPVALSCKDTETTIYITKNNNVSSLYPPNREVLTRVGVEPADYEIIEEAVIETETLETFCRKNDIYDIDIIKSDTQGSEYDIIQGGKSVLQDSVLCLDLEVYFKEIYQEQGLFSDIHRELQSLDFELIDLRFDLFTEGNRISRRSDATRIDGELVEADALYFKDPNKLASNELEKLVAISILFGKLSYSEFLSEKYDIGS